jgi:3-dehydroquinate dehydratase type I
MTAYHIGKLALGTPPLVVGTLSSRSSLPSARRVADYPCNVVEVRLDQIGTDTPGWLGECQAIEAAGVPVLLTLRLASEGGNWVKPDAERLPFLSSALNNLSCIDVEFASELCVPLCRQAAELGKCVVVSSHNFQETPDYAVLKRILDKILAIPNAIPKITTMINTEVDVETLQKLLEITTVRPICILGMGSLGTKTRTLFPTLGACLAYGYLDVPSAPGQLSSSQLMQALARKNP